MKSSDLLSRLPSVGELLSNPQVKSVVDRLSESAATRRVRGVLDELRGELTKRAGDLPSLGEVIDRVTRYIARDDGWRLSGAINATGRLRGGPWATAPLADAAIDRMLLLAKDFAAESSAATHPAHADATAELLKLTGAEAAIVLHGRPAALALLLAELAPRPPLVIARGEVGEVEPGCRFTDLCNAAGARLHEVGSIDSVTVEDYTAALAAAARSGGDSADGQRESNGGVVIRLAADSPAPAEPTARPSTTQLAQAAHAHGALLVEDLASGPLVDLPAAAGGAGDRPAPAIQGLQATSAGAALAAGADLVLLRGDGLVGGPAVCIVLGRSELIDRLGRQTLAAAVRAAPFSAAALAATLKLLSDPAEALLQTPVLSLLSTPLDNLRNRAERLAPQIAQSPLVAAAEAMPLPAGSTAAAGLPVRTDSFAIALTPAAGSAQEMADRLRSGSPRVWGRVEGQRLLLDMRTVFPRQDLALVAAFPAEPGAKDDGGQGGDG
ncbi:MAG: hypothetical protein AAF790_13090 [Planctomycetota bacterium]